MYRAECPVEGCNFETTSLFESGVKTGLGKHLQASHGLDGKNFDYEIEKEGSE